MADRSMPASLASRRASGEAKVREASTPLTGFFDGRSGEAPLGTGFAACSDLEAEPPPSAGFAAGGADEASAFSAFFSALGAAPSPPPFAASETSSPSPASTAISALTFTPSVPAGTTILATVPSSTASTSMVALSVSISAITSPGATWSPSLTSHLARLPSSIVGERAGMVMLIGIYRSPA